MRKFAKMAVAAAIAGMAMVAQAGIVIDDFSIDQGHDANDVLLFDNTNNTTGFRQSVNGATANIIGGQRDLYVEKIADGSGRIEASVEGSKYRYSTPEGTAGTAFLKWDGQNEANLGIIAGDQTAFMGTLDATGLGGQNLKAGGNAFVINVFHSDIGFRFALTVFSGVFGEKWTTLLLEAEPHNLGLPAGSPILFADFEGATDVAGSTS